MQPGDVVYFKTGYRIVKDVIIRVLPDRAYSETRVYYMVSGVYRVPNLGLLCEVGDFKDEYERQENIDFITSYVKNCSTETLNRIARIIHG